MILESDEEESISEVSSDEEDEVSSEEPIAKNKKNKLPAWRQAKGRMIEEEEEEEESSSEEPAAKNSKNKKNKVPPKRTSTIARNNRIRMKMKKVRMYID